MKNGKKNRFETITRKFVIFVSRIGFLTNKNISLLGKFSFFSCSIISRISLLLLHPRLVLHQIFLMGNHSVLLIILSGTFVGLVLGFQGFNMLIHYGSQEVLGQFITVSLVQELGPVISALLFSGRVGTSIAAEIGLMKISEQISAMDIMAIDPIERILVPRFLGGLIALPFLTLIFSSFGILGGCLVLFYYGTEVEVIFLQIYCSIDLWNDIFHGFIKSLIFGMLITLIALYQGWNTKLSSDGIAHATTKTVISGSLFIFLLDFYLTILMSKY